MKKITVINVYGQKNIGDMAIRNAGLNLIEEALGNNQIYLLCESPKSFSLNVNLKSPIEKEYAPYGYAINTDTKPLSYSRKAFRFIKIITTSGVLTLAGIINKNSLPKKGFYRYIRLLSESDLVIAMGGGYFITSHPIKDYFGICLNVLPIYIAKLFRKKIIILPSSFGPFATNVHEKITGHAVKNTIFMARDNISLNYVKKYSKHAKFFPDLALYDWGGNNNKEQFKYFVLTLREGLKTNRKKQREIEEEIAKFIKHIWEKHNLFCIFIPMASNPIEENDLVVARRIEKIIDNYKIFKTVIPQNPEEAKNILTNAKIAVCNRLHSAILSATVFTPFITIAYAHKTKGFMKYLNLEEWNIDMQDVTFEILINKFNSLITKQQYSSFTNKLNLGKTKINQYKPTILEELKTFSHYSL